MYTLDGSLDGSIDVDQLAHCTRLEMLPKGCSFDEFRSRRHMLVWLSQSRPDVCATANILSQVTSESFNDTHVKILNSMIKHVMETPDHYLRHHPLDENTLRVAAFSDSSFANNPDMSTQLGYIILLTDHPGRANVMHFSSYKSKQVVRFVLGG